MTYLALAVCSLALACSQAVCADENDGAEEKPPELRYVIGGAVNWRPEYAGAARHDSKPALLWALRWGRWRISTSGANAVMGFGRDISGPGASTELFSGERLRLGVALRMDSGRSSSDASTTAGLPDVRRTLRGRLFASYALTPDWQASGSLSQDLLGRQGGLVLGLDLGWRLRQSTHSEWTVGVGFGAGDGRNLRSYFGVTPQGAQASGLNIYTPSAGLRDVHAGVGWIRALTPRWIAFANAGVSRLVGPAADSPLTQKPNGSQVGIGLAYRN